MDSYNVCGVFIFFLIKYIYLYMFKIVNFYVLVYIYLILKIFLDLVLWKIYIFFKGRFFIL